MARVRVRQHVNPLSKVYQNPVNPPDWTQIYADANKPLHLDIGCAWGRFLLSLSQIETDWNYLGLEIRGYLVEEANALAREKSLTNLHYLFCNATKSLTAILASLPPGTLQRVTVQFPDPWFKNRHQKRRMLQPEMVEELAKYLAPGGEVFLQSDVQEVALEMCKFFEQNPAFRKTHAEEWLAENPLPVATEREMSTLKKGLPVYRCLFVRVENN